MDERVGSRSGMSRRNFLRHSLSASAVVRAGSSATALPSGIGEAETRELGSVKCAAGVPYLLGEHDGVPEEMFYARIGRLVYEIVVECHAGGATALKVDGILRSERA